MLIFNEDQKIYLIKNYLSKIGKISYSLYLWHFPLLVIGANTFAKFDDIKKIIFIILCFLLSILSYNIIEKKFRKKTTSISLYLFLFLIIFLVVSDYAVNQKKDKFPTYVLDNFYLADESSIFLKDKSKYSITKKRNIFSFQDDSLKYSPQFNVESKKNKILIVGDSHSKDLFNIFETNKNLFSNFEFARYGINLVDFSNYRKNIFLESFNFKNADYIIFTARYKKESIVFINQLIELSKKHNKKLILTLKRPEFEGNNYKNQTVLDLHYLNKIKINKDNFDEFLYKKLNNKSSEEINFILKEKYKDQVPILDLYNIICDDQKKRCHSVDENDKKILYDYGHFTLSGSKYLGEILYKKNYHKKLFTNK